jgi:hypothetical protein
VVIIHFVCPGPPWSNAVHLAYSIKLADQRDLLHRGEEVLAADHTRIRHLKRPEYI